MGTLQSYRHQWLIRDSSISTVYYKGVETTLKEEEGVGPVWTGVGSPKRGRGIRVVL